MFYCINFIGIPNKKIEEECVRIFKKLEPKLEAIKKKKFGFESLRVDIIPNMGSLIAAQAYEKDDKSSKSVQEYGIRVNQRFFQEDLNALEHVFVHEIAHLVVYHLYGFERAKKIDHGKEWQEIMIDFGFEAKQFHDLPRPNSLNLTKEEQMEDLIEGLRADLGKPHIGKYSIAIQEGKSSKRKV